MPIDILMPALSPTMTEGNIAKWLVKEGDVVSPGDVIAEIETDKALMEVESADAGTVGKITIGDGSQNVAVGTIIGVLLKKNETKADLQSSENKGAKEDVESNAKTTKEEQNQSENNNAKTQAQPSSAANANNATNAGGNAHVFASPLAKKIAKINNINLSSISGSGPNGRIVKRDVENSANSNANNNANNNANSNASSNANQAVTQSANQNSHTAIVSRDSSSAQSAPSQSSSGGAINAFSAPHTIVPVDYMRAAIARRLTESKSNVPHFYLNTNCDVSKILKHRTELNNSGFVDDDGNKIKITINDIIVKAAAVAVAHYPEMNRIWQQDENGKDVIVQFKRVDVSIAVAVPNGLLTPVITGADKLTLLDLSKTVKALAEKAKAGKLTPQEMTGGSFSVSNLGMMGVNGFQAIINPPQSFIISIGSPTKTPVFDENNNVVPVDLMNVGISVDHRVIDGAQAAQFLKAFKEVLANPVMLSL